MTNTTTTRSIILLMRLAMGWIFIYAASHQVLVPGFSIAGFLGSTKTFHWLFAPFTSPGTDAVLSFLVSYGHLFIGLSLVTGLMVRISGAFGIAMMVLYWMAHMDFPYISDTNYLLVDPHVLFALTLGLLVAVRAGHIYGLDGWVSKQSTVQHSKALAWATA